MTEQSPEVKKLAEIANSMDYPPKLRSGAIESLSRIGTHEALLALLEMAGNEAMTRQDRELALKHAAKIVKSSH